MNINIIQNQLYIPAISELINSFDPKGDIRVWTSSNRVGQILDNATIHYLSPNWLESFYHLKLTTTKAKNFKTMMLAGYLNSGFCIDVDHCDHQLVNVYPIGDITVIPTLESEEGLLDYANTVIKNYIK